MSEDELNDELIKALLENGYMVDEVYKNGKISFEEYIIKGMRLNWAFSSAAARRSIEAVNRIKDIQQVLNEIKDSMTHE